jgi:hypothetical protein
VSKTDYFIQNLYVLSVKEPKDFVHLLDNVPHDWLFLQCKAVVVLSFPFISSLHDVFTCQFFNMFISSRCIMGELEQQLLGLRLQYLSLYLSVSLMLYFQLIFGCNVASSICVVSNYNCALLWGPAILG